MSAGKLHRRDFLKCVAGGTAAALLRLGLPSSLGQVSPTTVPSSPSIPLEAGKSLIVRARSHKIMDTDGINRRILRELITLGLNEMIGVTSFSQALKALFSKKDTIGFKFNSSYARLLGTNGHLAEELLRLLWNAGYDPARLVFIEVEPNDDTLPSYGRVKFGWGPVRNFGSGADSFASVLDQVTALVNVGSLKANAVAGMSGCLKNIAYGLIKHPARYHANGCAPYIADIYNLPVIRNKVRVNLLSTLRILLDEGLNARNCMIEDNGLIFGRDPVAVDAMGFEILDAHRKKRGFKPLIEEGDFPRQLVAGAQKGIGVFHPDQIQRKDIEID
jgi:hypothetical protein